MTIKIEEIVLNENRDVKLTAMIQSVSGELNVGKRPAVIILPGGGYGICSDREAEVVAYPYLQSGYHAFILRYSVGIHKTWPNPLRDFDQAMEYIIEHAETRGIYKDQIVVIGFSAGGHLAACAATMARHRPVAAILGYPATEINILSLCQPDTYIPSPTQYVDYDTAPCFIFAACDDEVVPIENSLNFMLALSQKGIMFESHIYAYGGHGFTTGEQHLSIQKMCSRVPDWVKDSIEFLNDVFEKRFPQSIHR